MNREIKLRAWDLESKKYILARFEWLSYITFVNPKFIFEQYTGFKDATGKEIYEGDIIRDTVHDGSTEEQSWSAVTWSKEYGWWCLDGAELLWGQLNSPIIGGNIHENAELLNET